MSQPDDEMRTFYVLRVRPLAERLDYVADLDRSLTADPDTLTPDQARWRRIGSEARTVMREIAGEMRNGQ